MKIFYVCYENLAVPAAWTTHVIEVVNHLAGLGHHVTLFAPSFENDNVDESVRIISIKTVATRFIGEYFFYWRLFWQLLKMGKVISPDVIYIREMGLNFSPYLIARLFRVPAIVEINGMVTEELKQAGYSPWKLLLIGFFRKFNLCFGDRIVAVTPELEQNLQRKYSIRNGVLSTIENGVNIQRFRAGDKLSARRQLNLPTDSFILIYVGSFYPHHGLLETLQIFSEMKQHEPNVKLLLVGDGALKQRLKTVAENNGISSDVIWAGRIPLQEIPNYISAADVCLLLFNSNNGHVTGRSIKILEYMSCSRPVIVSQTPELVQFVSQHRCGLAVDSSDYESAAETIRQLLHNESWRASLGNSGRKAVESVFQWEHTTRKIEKLCYSALKTNYNRTTNESNL